MILVMLNGFGSSGLIWVWRNMQVIFGRPGKVKARQQVTSDGFERAHRDKRQEATSQSYQIPHSWLWFTECPNAMITWCAQSSPSLYIAVRHWEELIDFIDKNVGPKEPYILTSPFNIRKMYFSHWEPPRAGERRRSVNLEASISGEDQTLGGHSGRSSE